MKTVIWITAFCMLTLIGSAFPLGGGKQTKEPSTSDGIIEKDAARELWMEGYVKMQEAKRAENDGNRIVARDLYGEARATFEQVAEEYPSWNPSLVEYRQRYCDARIRRLQAAAEADATELSKSELVTLVGELRQKVEPLQERAQQQTEKRQELERAVAELRGKLAELRDAEQRLAAKDSRIETLEGRAEQLEQEKAQLAEALRGANEQVSDAEARIEDLQQKIATLREQDQSEQVAVLRSELDTLERQNSELKKTTATLEQAKKSTREELSALRQDHAALERKHQTQTEALQECSSARETLEKRAAELEKQQVAAKGEDTEPTAEQQALADRNEKLQSKVQELSGELAETKKHLGALADADREAVKRNQQVKTLETDLAGREERIAKLTETIQQLEVDKAEMKAKLAAKPPATTAKQQQQDAANAARERRAELLEEARQAERKGDMEQAVAAYRQILETDPDKAEIRVHLGTLLLDRGKNAEAQSVLEPAFQQNPDNTAVYGPLGLSLLRQEKADMALAVFARGVALAPRNADFQRYLGVAARSLGWTEATEAAFRRSFNLDSTNGETAYNLALHYMTLDPPNPRAAKQWYEQALELGQAPDKELEDAIKAFMQGD